MHCMKRPFLWAYGCFHRETNLLLKMQRIQWFGSSCAVEAVYHCVLWIPASVVPSKRYTTVCCGFQLRFDRTYTGAPRVAALILARRCARGREDGCSICMLSRRPSQGARMRLFSSWKTRPCSRIQELGISYSNVGISQKIC